MSTRVERKNKKAMKPPTSTKIWAIRYLFIALLFFVMYQFIFPWEKLPYSIYDFIQLWLPPTAVNEALVYIICALGLNVVVGFAGLLDLGYVAFWAIGGYSAGWLMSDFFHQWKFNALSSVDSATQGLHINFWLVLVIGGAVCAFFGILIGVPTLRLKSDYLALVTLGFAEIIPQFFYNGEDINGFNLSNGTKGITRLDPIPTGFKNLGPFDFGLKFIIFIILAAVMVFISLRLRKGRLGRAWLAIREDELAASMMGVPLMRTKLASYAVGAVAGGLGGVAFATHVDGVYVDRFNFAISIFLLAMVVLGGMGNVWGVILGAFLLSWVNSTGLKAVGETFNGRFGTEIDFPSYTFLIFGLVLILMILFKREGLLPESRLKLMLHEGDEEKEEAK